MVSRSSLAGLLALALGAGIGTKPASAQEVSLQDLIGMVQVEPGLAREIDVELRRQDLRAAGNVCLATPLGPEWHLIGTTAGAPYECRIGSSLLRIEAQRTYFDANGRRLGQVGQAPQALLFTRARYFREGNFRWTWSR